MYILRKKEKEWKKIEDRGCFKIFDFFSNVSLRAVSINIAEYSNSKAWNVKSCRACKFQFVNNFRKKEKKREREE